MRAGLDRVHVLLDGPVAHILPGRLVVTRRVSVHGAIMVGGPSSSYIGSLTNDAVCVAELVSAHFGRMDVHLLQQFRQLSDLWIVLG